MYGNERLEGDEWYRLWPCGMGRSEVRRGETKVTFKEIYINILVPG